MSTADTQPPPGAGLDNEASAGPEAGAAADAKTATTPQASPDGGAGAQDQGAGPEPSAGADGCEGDGSEPPVADATQESAPRKPGLPTDLDAAAHRIVNGPDAVPPRRRPAVRSRRPAAPESPPWRGPPRPPPSEQVRPPAVHTNSETPARGHAPASDQAGPTGPRTVEETPGGPRNRARHGRVAGIVQATSHAQGETPAGGDSRAMEQRMHPRGPSAALAGRLAEVQAQRTARIDAAKKK